MDDITVNLDLSNHCIETAAKKEFKSLVDLMLSENQNGDESVISEKIELLRKFLLVNNFIELRASDIRLSGTRKSEVVIFRDMNGNPALKIIE